MPAIYKPAICPLEYGLISGPRGRLPLTGVRGVRCGGIMVVMIKRERTRFAKNRGFGALGPLLIIAYCIACWQAILVGRRWYSRALLIGRRCLGAMTVAAYHRALSFQNTHCNLEKATIHPFHFIKSTTSTHLLLSPE
jgi:hypothetical protein